MMKKLLIAAIAIASIATFVPKITEAVNCPTTWPAAYTNWYSGCTIPAGWLNAVENSIGLQGSATGTIYSMIAALQAGGGSSTSTTLVHGVNGVTVMQVGINATATLDTTYAAIWTALETFKLGITVNGPVTLASTTSAIAVTNSSGQVLAFAGSNPCLSNQAAQSISATGTLTCINVVTSTTGNWTGLWQGNNSTSFYSASNPSGYISTALLSINGFTNSAAILAAGAGLSVGTTGSGGISTTTYSLNLNNGSTQTCSANQYVNSLTSGGITSCGTVTITVNGVASSSFNFLGDNVNTSSTTNGATTTFKLLNSGASAGTYTCATVTVNAQGIVTAASTGSCSGAGGITSINTATSSAQTIVGGTGESVVTVPGTSNSTTTVTLNINGGTLQSCSTGQVMTALSGVGIVTCAVTINTIAGVSTSSIAFVAGTGFSFATTTNSITFTNTGVTSLIGAGCVTNGGNSTGTITLAVTCSTVSTSTANTWTALQTFAGGATINGTTTLASTTNALLVANGLGQISGFAGSSCSGGQFGTGQSATGTWTCGTPSGSGGGLASTTPFVAGNLAVASGTGLIYTFGGSTCSYGNVEIGIASSGTALCVPASSTAIFYVDSNRTDTYTQNGSYQYPYKTFSQAIASSTGFGQYAYLLSPGTYVDGAPDTFPTSPFIIMGNESVYIPASGVTFPGSFDIYDLTITSCGGAGVTESDNSLTFIHQFNNGVINCNLILAGLATVEGMAFPNPTSTVAALVGSLVNAEGTNFNNTINSSGTLNLNDDGIEGSSSAYLINSTAGSLNILGATILNTGVGGGAIKITNGATSTPNNISAASITVNSSTPGATISAGTSATIVCTITGLNSLSGNTILPTGSNFLPCIDEAHAIIGGLSVGSSTAPTSGINDVGPLTVTQTSTFGACDNVTVACGVWVNSTTNHLYIRAGQANINNLAAISGGLLGWSVTSTGNGAGVSTTLETLTIPTSTIQNAGDYWNIQIGGTIAGTAATNKEIQLAIGSSTIFDTTSHGSLLGGQAFAWAIDAFCNNVTATTSICTTSFTDGASSTAATDDSGDAGNATASFTITSSTVINLYGIGTNGSDVVANQADYFWWPAK